MHQWGATGARYALTGAGVSSPTKKRVGERLTAQMPRDGSANAACGPRDGSAFAARGPGGGVRCGNGPARGEENGARRTCSDQPPSSNAPRPRWIGSSLAEWIEAQLVEPGWMTAPTSVYEHGVGALLLDGRKTRGTETGPLVATARERIVNAARGLLARPPRDGLRGRVARPRPRPPASPRTAATPRARAPATRSATSCSRSSPATSSSTATSTTPSSASAIAATSSPSCRSTNAARAATRSRRRSPTERRQREPGAGRAPSLRLREELGAAGARLTDALAVADELAADLARAAEFGARAVRLVDDPAAGKLAGSTPSKLCARTSYRPVGSVARAGRASRLLHRARRDTTRRRSPEGR